MKGNKLVVGLVTGLLAGLPAGAADNADNGASRVADNAPDYEVWDTKPDTWVAVDELGRTVASSDGGVDRAEKDPNTTIGMFYYVWHGAERPTNKDITELLKVNPDNPDWGAVNAYHWGSKPWLGYYNGGNVYVVMKHMQMLVDAGVDFIFLDYTNSVTYFNQTQVVLDELRRRKSLGLKYPRVAFIVYSNAKSTLQRIYMRYYRNNPQYEDLWYYHEGKPLALADKSEMAGTAFEDFFTYRYSWAWLRGKKADQWAWLESYPQEPGWTYGTNSAGMSVKKTEQISVSVAQHATTKIGKSYHNGTQPAVNKQGLCDDTPKGLYFQEQWDRAISVHPPVVMISQFNEWIAMRQLVTSGNLSDCRPGVTPKVGESFFVDVYNAEFSRDIEPSTHPMIRDNYYLQMVSNARKYRGVETIPVPTKSISIDLNGSFDQWDEESLEFLDDKGDALYTSNDAQDPSCWDRDANDIIRTKVTKDADNYYFYVECMEDISDPAESDHWMKLLLNTDLNYGTGWSGYDYMVRKNTSGVYSLMRNSMTGKYSWTTVCPVEYRIEGPRMMLSIPRSQLKDYGKQIDIDFKWADNTPDGTPDVLSFISDGDVAPNGRFNYRYKGSKVVGVGSAEAISDGIAKSEPIIRTAGGELTVEVPAGDSGMSVKVYDTQGRAVAAGVAGQTVKVGRGMYIVSWQGSGSAGSTSVMVR